MEALSGWLRPGDPDPLAASRLNPDGEIAQLTGLCDGASVAGVVAWSLPLGPMLSDLEQDPCWRMFQA